jgi:hypothetical protein
MTMHTTQLPTSTAAAKAVVDLGAIDHNVRVLRELAGSADVMAVVKADGYGHGATRVGQAAIAAGASELGVATLDEALALRRDGVTAPVLCWLHTPGTDFAPALAADVQLGVSSTRQLAEVLDAVTRTGIATAPVLASSRSFWSHCGGRPPTTRSGCAASCRTWRAVTIQRAPSMTNRHNGSRKCVRRPARPASSSRWRTCATLLRR